MDRRSRGVGPLIAERDQAIRQSDEPGSEHVLAANIGFKHRLRDSFSIHGANGKNLREDIRGGPDVRIYAGVKWEFAAPRHKRKEPS